MILVGGTSASAPPPPGLLTVELNRDGANAPWGFRLKGGRDVDGGTPLEVVKISLGSACEGVLRVGDRLVSINHVDARRLSHADAQDIFRRAGTSLIVGVSRRGAFSDISQHDPPLVTSPAAASGHSTTTRPTMMLQHQAVPPPPGRTTSSLHPPPAPPAPHQPYRTTQLVFPSASSVYYDNRASSPNPSYPKSFYAPLDDHHRPPPPAAASHFQSPWSMPPSSSSSSPSASSNKMAARQNVVDAIGSQPFRTTPLVLPGAKVSHDQLHLGVEHGADSFGGRKQAPPPYHYQSGAAGGEASNITHQPFRTSPLVTPAPQTINDVRDRMMMMNAPNNRNPGGAFASAPSPIHYSSPMSHNSSSGPNITSAKTIDIGGVKKQVVTQQFNSPLNLYSDETIADAVINNLTGPPATGSGDPQSPPHPGYVQSSRPHLPTPKDATFSKPQQSATFKMILESEMDKARDQQGIMGTEFQQQVRPPGGSRPSSSASSAVRDPVMLDSSISQSTSFKRVMQSVLAEGGGGHDDDATAAGGIEF